MQCVYGKYSMGSGSSINDQNLVYSEIDNDDVIASYDKAIRFHLEKAGIFEKIKVLQSWTLVRGGKQLLFGN